MSSIFNLCPFAGDFPGRTAVLEVTRACNLRCPSCLRAGGEGTHGSFDASNTIHAFHRLSVSSVLLSGGEPLLHPGLFDMIKALACANLNPGICTNGTLVDAGVARLLRDAGLGYAILSLDGDTAVTHDRARIGLPSFDAVCRACASLTEAGIRVDCTMLVGSHNEHTAENVVALAARLGVQCLTVTPIMLLGRATTWDGGRVLDGPTSRRVALRLSRAAGGVGD
ncbi:MAG: radical SAM protein, partial [Acidobacteriota bacterium]